MARESPNEKLIICGGSNDPQSIGKQCTVVNLVAAGHRYNVMVDCGLEFYRGSKGETLKSPPNFSLIAKKSIDCVLITHHHVDHVGGLGYARSQGVLKDEAQIFCTPQAGPIIGLAMEDGLKQKVEYGRFDVMNVLGRVRTIDKPGVHKVLPGLEVLFMPNGHIPGSAAITLPLSSGTKGLFTGDMCFHDQPIVDGMDMPSKNWPKEWIPDEIWGSDLTYMEDNAPIGNEVERLIYETKRALGEDKHVIIPAFGVGRGQNLAVWLSRAGVDVLVDGVIRGIYKVFQENRWSGKDRRLSDMNGGSGGGSGIEEISSSSHRQTILRSNKPRVIISTGGMADFGPVVRYLEEGLPMKNVAVFFTSWLAPGSNGHKIVEGSKIHNDRKSSEDYFVVRLRISDESGEKPRFIRVPVRARIDHFRLGAHGDFNDFKNLAGDIVKLRGRPLRRIVLTHGTHESMVRAASELAPYADERVFGMTNTEIVLS